MDEKIKSIEELERAQAAANIQGTSIVNYSEWSKIIQELNEAGVESTGSLAGDKAKLQHIEKAVEAFIKENQVQEIAQQKTQETQQLKGVVETDKEQQLKSTVANATSSMIMADYMKYYHLI